MWGTVTSEGVRGSGQANMSQQMGQGQQGSLGTLAVLESLGQVRGQQEMGTEWGLVKMGYSWTTREQSSVIFCLY
jgi:hypothetical protein